MKCNHGCEIKEGRYANGCHACTIERLIKENAALKVEVERIVYRLDEVCNELSKSKVSAEKAEPERDRLREVLALAQSRLRAPLPLIRAKGFGDLMRAIDKALK